MSLTLHTNLRALLLAVCTLPLAACPEKETETETGSGTATEPSTEGPGTETTSNTPTTTGTPTEGTATEGTATATEGTTTESATETAGTDTQGGNTTDETTTVDETTTMPVDTDTETGGPVPPELDAACLAACEKFFECFPMPPFPDVDACKGDCADALGSGEGCLDVTVAFNSCIGTMTCDELMTAFVDEEFGPCQDEFDAMGMTCESADECAGFAGGDGGDNCSIGQECPGQPTVEFKCEGDTCTCLVGDVPQGECPAEAGFCALDFEQQTQAAAECCGFDL